MILVCVKNFHFLTRSPKTFKAKAKQKERKKLLQTRTDNISVVPDKLYVNKVANLEVSWRKCSESNFLAMINKKANVKQTWLLLG